jgi:hypothetical protein
VSPETDISDEDVRSSDDTAAHEVIWPSILYFGTPIALVTTLNADGSANIGPMSSAWALGYTIVMGWESTAHTLANLERAAFAPTIDECCEDGSLRAETRQTIVRMEPADLKSARLRRRRGWRGQTRSTELIACLWLWTCCCG